ncbi:hypothetical protein Tco_0033859 [Tanacetum coccineum]
MLRAAGVQIPENNLDGLHSLREEVGTSKTIDPQDLLGSGVYVSRAIGFLRGTTVFLVIREVLGTLYLRIVKVVEWITSLIYQHKDMQIFEILQNELLLEKLASKKLSHCIRVEFSILSFHI